MNNTQHSVTTNSPHYDVVLIDDDTLIHMTWKMSLKRAGKTCLLFTDPIEFFKEQSQIDRNTKIYIDVNLKDNISGIEVSREVAALGFQNIYLATGSVEGSIEKPEWIKDILGRSPPV